MFTTFGDTTYSIGATTPGQELRKGGEYWGLFCWHSPMDRKMVGKMNTLCNKNDFLRPTIF
jgi:hypothetical protein